jgi:hypothetical protein
VTRDVEAHVSEHIHQGRAAKRVVLAIGGDGVSISWRDSCVTDRKVGLTEEWV